MGNLMLLKRVCLLLFVLIISASLLSTSHAGRRLPKYTNILEKECVAALNNDDQNIHKRLLRVNTQDYGKYDPAPTFHKPPFKLIPN